MDSGPCNQPIPQCYAFHFLSEIGLLLTRGMCPTRLRPHPRSRQALALWGLGSPGPPGRSGDSGTEPGGILMQSAQCCPLNSSARDKCGADCDCLTRFHYVIADDVGFSLAGIVCLYVFSKPLRTRIAFVFRLNTNPFHWFLFALLLETWSHYRTLLLSDSTSSCWRSYTDRHT